LLPFFKNGRKRDKSGPLDRGRGFLTTSGRGLEIKKKGEKKKKIE